MTDVMTAQRIALLIALVPAMAWAGYLLIDGKGREGWVGAVIAGCGAFIASVVGIVALIALACVPKKKPTHPVELQAVPAGVDSTFGVTDGLPGPPAPSAVTKQYVSPQPPAPPGPPTVS